MPSPKAWSPTRAEGSIKDLGLLTRMLSIEKNGKILGVQPAARITKKSYTISGSSEQIDRLPFSPTRGGAPIQWSPRAVAQEACEYLDKFNDSSAPKGDSTESPIRKLCKENLEKQLPVKAVIHHLDVDPVLVKKSREDTSLPTVTTVSRRTQRVLSAAEVAKNAEKSIAFFRKNRELNERINEQRALKGGAWSKLRKKFLNVSVPRQLPAFET